MDTNSSNGRSLNNQRGTEILNAGIDELSLNLYGKTLKEKLPINIKRFEEEAIINFMINKIFILVYQVRLIKKDILNI